MSIATTHIENFAGAALTPGHHRYDEARAVYNGSIDRRPALIAEATDARDVAAAIQHGRELQLPIAVRAGGHSGAGYGVVDDGLVIDVRPIRRIEVDAAARTVRAGAGLTWAELDAATQAHGLAVTGGRVSHTGVAGLTLGSGSGWLERMHGLTTDNLVSRPWSPPTAASWVPASPRAPTSSGGCAVAAATSASSPTSSWRSTASDR